MAKLGELDEFLGKYKYDVVDLQETRLRKGNQNIIVQCNKAYYQDLSFQSGPEHGGVIILVADHLVAFASKVRCTEKDQLWVRISSTRERGDLLLCSAYMPQESAPKTAREAAFKSVKAKAKKFKQKGHTIVICGDLNAKLGKPADADEERLLGKHGAPGSRSSNGKLVVGLMKKVKLFDSGGQQQPPLSSTG